MSSANSAIDDYLVASFPLPAAASSSRPLHPAALDVTAVQYTKQARQDSRLAVATPGVGVSVYDLADQTPLSSITVGPSFSPTTAAIARSTPSTSSQSIRVKSARRTWVGVETPEGKGEIWCWHEEERKEGSTEGDAGKAVWPISEPLAALAAPRTLPSHIVFLSSSGALALAPADDLTSLASLPAPLTSTPFTRQTLRLIPISPTSAPDFLPPALVASLPAGSRAHLALIVRSRTSSPKPAAEGSPSSLVEIGKKKFKKTPRPSSSAVIDAADATSIAPVSEESEVEIVLVDAEVNVPDEFEPRLGLVSLGKVEVKGRQVVVSDEGFVTALSSDSVLSSFRLSIPPSFVVDTYSSLFFPPEPLSLPAPTLSPIKFLTLSTSALTPSRASLLALHASFIALASPRPSSIDSSAAIVSITFWDARFGSVIATTDLSVPSAVSTSLSSLSLSLSLPNKHTAILTLSPTSDSGAGAGSRTALFALPLSPLPAQSVLAAVVGKHSLTSRFLASPTSSESVLERAKRAEPMRSLAKGGEKKLALVEAGRKAREAVLERLEGVLRPLKEQASAVEQEKAVREAEGVWERWLEEEKDRLWEYNKDKVRVAMKKEKERRVKAIVEGEEGDEEVTRYKKAKKRIERALVEAGAAVRPGTNAGGEEKGKKSWKDVTAARIKGVNDKYRYMYHRERNTMEEEMGKTVKEFDWDEAVNKVERYEPSLPSSFITALLRLSFPVPLDAPSSDLVVATAASAASEKAWRHPTKIVGYLLKRELVGENQVEGGVTRFLARAGDWPNILTALETIPDIPESTTVSLLDTVVRKAQASQGHSLDVEDASSTTIPSPIPSLSTFLRSFLKSPYTPSVLRSALQKQLSAVEAIPILEQCDKWLATWLKSAQAAEEDEEKLKKRKGKGSKAVQVDLFRLVVPGEEEQLPLLEEIVPFVQAILDAHFVTLLLQRQAHRLLRRLAQHISLHTALVNDLSSLLGALSIYSRKKDDQRRTAVEEASAAVVEKRKDGVREFGETMERRIKAQEKHAEVGAYAVEEFFL
ncbi:RNA binding protein [Rhodotorula toruloides]|uniref:RNA binding protein n=1 Tax=Rhodotorula toruloides TaxID=5286 RepID=A0A2T0AGK1_RHOTO|nr:RNA binding protein [Rhodotorula toruloides]PRQ77139.1 RNA binding protein [Rhodotorula toruloides]